jgi:hypothetical protein
MIDTYDGKFINADDLMDWLNNSLKVFLSKDTHISIVPQVFDCKGPSRFFAEIDVQENITIQQLLSKVITEHSRGSYIHFYVDDVVQAAVTAGVLQGNHFYLHYKW